MKRFSIAAPIVFFCLAAAPIGCGGSEGSSAGGSSGGSHASNSGTTGSATPLGGAGGDSSKPLTAGTGSRSPSGGGAPGTVGGATGTSGAKTTGGGTGGRPSGGGTGNVVTTGGGGTGGKNVGATGSTPATTTGGAGGGKSTVVGTGVRAVIIKAAGYVGTAGPDTLSSATTEPYNTHVFADALAQRLSDLKVQTQVVAWMDCEKASCVHVPDATSTAAIVVFAGVTHDGNLPEELQALVPALAGISPAPKVTSALTSCNKLPGVDSFMTSVKGAGLTTIPGISLQADVGSTLTDSEMNTVLTAFAKQLVGAI